MVLLCCYLNHKILNYHSLKDITFSNKLIFHQFHYSNQIFASNVTQKDFHTGIPLQAPKFWRPKEEVYLYLQRFLLCFFLLNLSKVCFQ